MNPNLRGLRIAGALAWRGLRHRPIVALGLALGPLIATVALLSVAAIPNLVERQSDRVTERVVERGDVAPDDVSTLLGAVDVDWFDDVRVHRIAVAAHTTASPPVWLTALPAPGEQIVSPALRDRIRGDQRFADTYTAQIVGELPDDVLAAPNELVTIVGVDQQALEQRGQLSASFVAFGDDSSDGPSSRAVRVMAVGLVLFVVVPVIALVVATAQMSTRRRQSRLAALSLIGLSPVNVRIAGAAETVLMAVVGSVLGAGLWLLITPWSQSWTLSGVSWWADDITLGSAAIVGVVAAVTAISVAVSLSISHDAVRRDRAIAANAAESVRVWWRVLILAIGAVLVAGCWLVLDADGNGWFVVFAVGNAMLMVGLIVLAPSLAAVASRILALRRSSIPASLASQRLRHFPTSTNRSIGGLAVIISLVVFSQVVLTTLDWAANRNTATDSAVTLTLRWGDLTEPELRNLDGVEAVLARQEISIGDDFAPVTFARCTDLAVFAVDIDGGCVDDTIVGVGPVDEVAATLNTSALVQPDTLVERDSEILSVIAPPATRERNVATDWVVALSDDADPELVERQIVRLSPATQIDDNRSDDERGRQISTYETAVQWALGVGFIISLAAAVLSAINAGSDLRHQLNILEKLGLPRPLIAHSELYAALTPVILAGAATGAAALLSSRAYLSLDDEETIIINFNRLSTVFVLAAAAMITVVAARLAASQPRQQSHDLRVRRTVGSSASVRGWFRRCETQRTGRRHGDST